MKRILVCLIAICAIGCGEEVEKINVYQPSPEEGKDVLIAKAYPNNNYGSLDLLHMLSRIKNDSLDDDNRFLIRFEIKDMPKSALIDSAFINLYSNGKKHEGENSFLIQRITFPWADDGVTWSSQPTVVDDNQVMVSAFEESLQNYRVNITPLIKDLVNNRERNYGFMFRLYEEEPPKKLLSFFSSNAKEKEKRPKLEIYFRVKE